MSQPYAAARSVSHSILAAALEAAAPLRAANDNGLGLGDDGLLRDALRHFAEHGLSAASRARDNAESAFLGGDEPQYRHWMAICFALDRRLAAPAFA